MSLLSNAAEVFTTGNPTSCCCPCLVGNMPGRQANEQTLDSQMNGVGDVRVIAQGEAKVVEGLGAPIGACLPGFYL